MKKNKKKNKKDSVLNPDQFFKIKSCAYAFYEIFFIFYF